MNRNKVNEGLKVLLEMMAYNPVFEDYELYNTMKVALNLLREGIKEEE